MFRNFLGQLLGGTVTQAQQPSMFSTQLPTQFLGLLDKTLASNLQTGLGPLSGAVTPTSGAGRAALDRNARVGQVDAGLSGGLAPGQVGLQQAQEPYLLCLRQALQLISLLASCVLSFLL